MDKIDEIKNLVESLEGDLEKFYGKGTNSAGLPIRKGMQQLKILAQDVRIDIMDKIKERQAAKKANK
jgi:hypothetical protein